MSSTNKTPNYALPQFIPTDKPTWLGDVNAAMLAIDTAMADNHTTAESANTSASAAVAQVQHAVDTANEAKVDSAAALQNATNAVGVAQNALNSATQATQTAQAATQTANAANNSAASAVATANQAKQTADGTRSSLTQFENYFSDYKIESVIEGTYGHYGYVTMSPAMLTLVVNAPTTVTENTFICAIYGQFLNVDQWIYNFGDYDILVKYNEEHTETQFYLNSATKETVDYTTFFVFSNTYSKFVDLLQKNTATPRAITTGNTIPIPIGCNTSLQAST